LRKPITCGPLAGVPPNPRNDRFYAEMSAKISALPPEAQHDAVFTLFGFGLKMMDRDTIHEVREELVGRFPQNGDNRDMGTVLIEIIDGHLILRALREETEAQS
jgi:hypothetical protein